MMRGQDTPSTLILKLCSDVGPALWQLYLDLMEQDVRRGSRHWKSSVVDIIIMLLGYLATPKVSQTLEVGTDMS